MNAGMYGMADGRGAGFPKLLGVAGKSQLTSNSHNVASAAGLLGIDSSATTLTPGVRTKLLNINGKGVLKYLGVAETGASGSATCIAEVFFDGVLFYRASWTHSGSSNAGPTIFGFAATGTGISLDFLPFSSSVEVFVTVGAVGHTSTRLAYLADLYQ